ncbi:hypothetical protein AB9X29_003744 [Vibrio vulnificus]
MKVDLKIAMAAFGLTSLVDVDRVILKRRYKAEMFKSHPDRGGCKQHTQLLNAAYATLKPKVPVRLLAKQSEPEEIEEDYCDWFFRANQGHPLHESGLASLKSLDQLIHQTFDIRDDETVPDVCYWHSRRSQPNSGNGIYFRKSGMDMRLDYWSGQLEFVKLVDITEGLNHRRKCGVMRVNVERFSSKYNLNNSMLSNVLKDWLGDAGDRENGFHWCDFYRQVIDVVQSAFRDQTNQGTLYGRLLTVRPANDGIFEADLDVDGSKVKISFEEISSLSVMNPFNLDRIKPLKVAPARWKIIDLVKVLVNGQFHSLKRNYYYTDDYAYDAALRSQKGYIDNPLKVAMEWLGESKRSCTYLYECGRGQVTFGFHSNDSSSLTLDLSNRYPLVSLEADVFKLEAKLQLAKA